MSRYEGATPERLKKGKVRIASRSTKLGGSAGHEEVWSTLLDYLSDKGVLGKEPDNTERYNAGIKLRQLWFTFNKTGKDISTLMMASEKMPFVEDAVTNADRAEEKFYKVMKALPCKYKPTVRYVCLEDKAQPLYDTLEALDALYGAFYRVEKK